MPAPALVMPSRPPPAESPSVAAIVLAPAFVPTSRSVRSVTPTNVAVLPPVRIAGLLSV